MNLHERKHRIKALKVWLLGIIILSLLNILIFFLIFSKQTEEKKPIKNKKDFTEILQKSYDSVVEDNRQWHNHVVRMQYIAGIKNPDTIFTYKEKIKHHINTNRTIKIK